jgi:cell division protein FtsZ
MIHFDLPKEQSSIIKVIGVGGGGSNAVNYMFSQNIDGVNFIICNTDAQAIAQSKVPNKIQLGPHLTQGLGAGANPLIGRQATEESLEEIKRILEVNTKMAFITAGMGGGTGTGGAPIIASICKGLGILTVGIVTTPFAYEGKKRIAQAEEGILALKNHVDTLLVISNDKLRHQFGNLKMKEAFAKADNVLATAAKCITDVIGSTGQINVDFADVCTVMRNGGVAILGSAAAEGENRAQKAIENALNSPLLNDSDIRGARWILININSAEGEHEFTMDEVEIIQNYLLSQAGEETDVILGLGYDSSLGSNIGITLIATGFEHKDPFSKTPSTKEEKKDDKIVMVLEMPVKGEQKEVVQPVLEFEEPEVSIKEEAPVEESTILFETEEKTAAIDLTPTMFEQEEAVIGKVEFSDEEMPEENEEDENAPVFYEISSSFDHNPVVAFDIPQNVPAPEKKVTPVAKAVTAVVGEKMEEPKPTITPAAAGYLVKPAQIYAAKEEPKTEEKPIEKITEEKIPLQVQLEEEEIFDMQIVHKPIAEEAEENKPEEILTIEMARTEEPMPEDEAEELKRRAMERIAKLRNLSFNINAADPNNEFETVPAYLRRNMEIHNQIADVESFYSNYTVKSNDNNQAEISTINTFLDGKKPD